MANFGFSVDTAANWTATNPVLNVDEMGFESDTRLFKVGNGSTAWNSLAYAGGGTTAPASSYAPAGLPYESGAGRASGFNAAGIAPSSGTLTLVAVWLPAGYTVGHLAFCSSSVAAATPTHWWFGLYDSSRVQLATTADQTTTAWAASTVKSLAVATTASGAATSFTTTYSGIHYVGILVTATTVPSLTNVTINSTLATTQTPVLVGTANSGQTTPPAFPFTTNALSAGGSLYWAGVGA